MARLEAQVDALAEQIERHHVEMVARIDGGPGTPWERSVRGRLHIIEGERVAQAAASAALAEARRERRLAAQDRAKAEGRNRTQFWRWVGAVIAAAAVALPYLPHLPW